MGCISFTDDFTYTQYNSVTVITKITNCCKFVFPCVMHFYVCVILIVLRNVYKFYRLHTGVDGRTHPHYRMRSAIAKNDFLPSYVLLLILM